MSMTDARGLKAFVLLGAQGAGKSTYAKTLTDENPRMKCATKDDIRFMVYDTNRYNERFDDNNKRFGVTVTQMHLQVIDMILRQQLDVIWDETNCSSVMRSGIVEYLKENYPGIFVEVHYLHSELDRCLKNNRKRRPEQIVPDNIIKDYYRTLTESIGPMSTASKSLYDEGFDRVKIIYK